MRLHKNKRGEWRPCNARKRKCRYAEHQVKHAHSQSPQSSVNTAQAKIEQILESTVETIPVFNPDDPDAFYKTPSAIKVGDRIWDGEESFTVSDVRIAFSPTESTERFLAESSGRKYKARDGYALFSAAGDYWWVSEDRKIRMVRSDEELRYLVGTEY